MRGGMFKVLGSLVLMAAGPCPTPVSVNDPLACGPLTTSSGAGLTAGSYDYAACDAEGRVLLVGRLVLETASGGAVTGTWNIDWAPGADQNATVGPQVGTGELQGAVENGELWLDLNPGWADNNVFLAAQWRADGGRGTWSFSTIIGPQAGGTFAARQR